MEEIANFLFEVGMLNKTPRTGFRFSVPEKSPSQSTS